MHRGHGLIAAALIAVAAPACAQPTAPVLDLQADGEVQIATDGKVSDYRLTSSLTPAVAALVDRDVRSWSFEPILVDGAPVVAKTAMHLSLKAEPSGEKDQYRIRIVNVRFGEPRRDSATRMRPPRYPQEAVSAHLGAKVLLAVRLDANGNVTDVQAFQTSLDARARTEREAERWRHMFESTSIAAARGWHYDLSETINGKTVGTNVIVPVVYSVHEMGAPPPKPGTWKAYVPGPVHPAPWMTDRQLADHQDVPALGDDEALALDSRFHLKDDVIGKAL